MQKIKRFLKVLLKTKKECQRVKTPFLYFLFRRVYHRIIYKLDIEAHHSVRISGKQNIELNGSTKIGMGYVGFVDRNDVTLLNINGKLVIGDNVRIGTGTRIDVGQNSTVEIGKNTYITASTKLIAMNGIYIGNNCAISWDCQFLDEDFHHLKVDNNTIANSAKEIFVGDNVWIGCGCKIYKGSFIASGCVVASDSVVKGRFEEKNCLIAGSPARIIKRDILWN